MKQQNYLDHMTGCWGMPVSENPTTVIMTAAYKALGLQNWVYETIEVEKGNTGDAIRGLKAFKMRGVNCTIPHKIDVMQYLDEISESAQAIGAVNTIVNDNGRLFGENTDGKGFMESLVDAGLDVKGKKAVVLGAGGAARAICVEIGLAGVDEIIIVNRNEEHAKSLIEIINKSTKAKTEFVKWDHTYVIPEDTDVVINATCVGLYPDVDALPNIDLDSIKPGMFVQDVIPNPIKTALIREMEKRGITCNTGSGMLVNQAALNVEMWTGLKPDKAVMLKALEEALA